MLGFQLSVNDHLEHSAQYNYLRSTLEMAKLLQLNKSIYR